ncbi:MAG TPA: SusC/RagA family TonB-linked outer membrane protein [Longimicrobium sp.]|jgi:TonB-linked SusC/RagA family outer membrane protein
MKTTRVVRSFAHALAALLGAATLSLAQGTQARVAGYVRAPAEQAPAAQARSGERTVTLRLDAAPLEAALHEIARQAQLRLTYSRESLDPARRVSAHLTSVSAEQAFAVVLEGTGLEAVPSARNRVAIVHRAPPAAAPPLEARAARTVIAGGALSVPAWLDAQEGGTIRGSVVEAGSARPVNGAQVVVVGTSRAAVTGAAGEYVLVGVPAGAHTLRAVRVGYRSAEQRVEVAGRQTVEVGFALTQAAVELDALVVTGTPGATSRRSVGNAVTTIDADQVTQNVVNTTVAELLQAKATGVTVLQSTGTPGAAGNIRIRGLGSLSGSSEPVIYVDGVRIHSGAGGSFRNNWQSPTEGQLAGGGQTASALDAVNPEDIESIEVIKGPAAATLYGADAANGVIQIITKKGRPGSQELQWNARVQFGTTDWGLDRRASFTTCDAVRVADPAEWPGCQGVAPGTVLRESFLDGALRSGALRNLELSVRGGGQGYSFFAAVDNDQEEGIFANSQTERTGGRANFAFYPSDRVDFTVSVRYTKSETAFPMTDNGPNVLEAAWTYQPGRAPQRGQTYGFAGGTPEQYEAYENTLRGDRVTLGTTLNFRPFPWFRNRLTVGGDINSRQANRFVPPGGLFAPTSGQMTQGAPRNSVYTFDYAGTVETPLPFTSLTSALSFGVQYTNSEYRNTIAQGTGFSTDLVRNIGSATNRHSWDEYLAVKSLGFFVQEQVAWRDRLFLTGAVRVDNSSIFGDEIDQLYYPKLSASYVISEEPFLARLSWLDNLKLRAAWGQAGNAPDPFAEVTSYGVWQSVDPITGEVTSGVRLVTLGNPDVKPERGSELEAGFDASLLRGRMGVELTFYDKRTRDALVRVPLAPSESGIAGGSQFRNLGEISNRGLEVAVSGTPLQTRPLTWDARLGFSTNRNRLEDFGFDTDPILIGVTTLNQRHVEGYPLAGYWVHDPVWDAEQNKYVPGEARYLGPSMPTREASLTNTFTLFGNLRLFTLLDYKGGYYLLNMTDWRRCRAELCEEVNDASVSAERKAQLTADLGSNDALYTQRADHVKIRDVSLTYTLSPRFSRRFGAERVALTLAGHNLGYLWKPDYRGLDPEVTFNGINQPGDDGQAFGWTRMDYWTVPMTRRITAAIDLSF